MKIIKNGGRFWLGRKRGYNIEIRVRYTLESFPTFIRTYMYPYTDAEKWQKRFVQKITDKILYIHT